MATEYTITGIGETVKMLDAVKRAAFTKQVMGEIGLFVMKAAVDRVDDQLDIKGRPLKQSLRAIATGGETLRDSGDMVRAYQITKTTSKRVTVGFKDALQSTKASAHQFGTRKRKGHAGLPKRPVFDLGEGDEDEIVKIVDRAIERAAE